MDSQHAFDHEAPERGFDCPEAAVDRSFLWPVIEHSVANVFDVAASDLTGPSRGRARIAFCRQVAMYLTHVHLGLTLTQTGLLFGRDRTTVAHACEIIENSRDDPSFDQSLELLERAFRVVEVFSCGAVEAENLIEVVQS